MSASGAARADGRPRKPVGAVVLAAGRGSRMAGANKLLEPIDGVPMVARVVDVALAAGAEPVVVVTGHEAPALEAALEGRAVRVVQNARWSGGMAGSLAAGVAALEGEVEGALVCLGDMPRVTEEDLRSLVEGFQARPGAAACVPVHGGRRGNPVLWAAPWFGRLRALEGDRGARALLDDPAAEVVEVPVPGAGVLLDVDDREALEAVRGAPSVTGRGRVGS